jgi:hypothetical protein
MRPDDFQQLPSPGKSTTSSAGGTYTFTGLTAGNGNVSAAKTDLGFTTASAGTFINGTNTLDFTLQAPTFATSGSGNTVFNIPVYVSRVRIVGTFSGNCQNFIVHINGSSVVNEILGSCSVNTAGTRYDGTLLVPKRVFVAPGQVVETLNSNGIAWTFTEVR